MRKLCLIDPVRVLRPELADAEVGDRPALLIGLGSDALASVATGERLGKASVSCEAMMENVIVMVTIRAKSILCYEPIAIILAAKKYIQEKEKGGRMIKAAGAHVVLRNDGRLKPKPSRRVLLSGDTSLARSLCYCFAKQCD